MVGRGVLRECLRDPDVTAVLAVGRSPLGLEHPKLTERLHADLFDLAALEPELATCDACFFCLGVSSSGVPASTYERVTHDLTLAVARTLARSAPGMAFVYVSGAGTDASGRGWARVKGRTEQALLALPLAATMFRPAVIVPMHGERSKTLVYRLFYALAGPMLPWWRRRWPDQVTTTEHVGRAMIAVARRGSRRPVLDTAAINGY